MDDVQKLKMETRALMASQRDVSESILIELKKLTSQCEASGDPKSRLLDLQTQQPTGSKSHQAVQNDGVWKDDVMNLQDAELREPVNQAGDTAVRLYRKDNVPMDLDPSVNGGSEDLAIGIEENGAMREDAEVKKGSDKVAVQDADTS